MSREIIAVDMDDVVVETAPSIIAYVNRTYGSEATINDFYSRDPGVWNAPDTETAVERVNSYLETDEYFENSPIMEAITALRGLRQVHKLYIVTGRPDFTELATRKWLKEHLPDLFEDVVFTNFFSPDKSRSKGSICQELGATILIDDHIEHCMSGLSVGVRPLLFGRYPWNDTEELPEGIERVEHWPDVERLLLSHDTD